MTITGVQVEVVSENSAEFAQQKSNLGSNGLRLLRLFRLVYQENFSRDLNGPGWSHAQFYHGTVGHFFSPSARTAYEYAKHKAPTEKQRCIFVCKARNIALGSNLNENYVVRDELPLEVIRLIIKAIDDPITLLHLSHSCSFFYRVIIPKDWYQLYCSQLPTWSQHVRLDDLPPFVRSHSDNDPSSSGGAAAIYLCTWKRHVVRDAYFHRRYARPIPTLSRSDLVGDEPETITMTIDPQEATLNNHVEATTTTTTTTALPSEQETIAIIDSRDVTDNNAAANDTPLPLPEQPFSKIQVPIGMTGKRANDPIFMYSPNYDCIGFPVYSPDMETGTTLSALMVEVIQPDNIILEPVLLFYNFPHFTTPIAMCDPDLWLRRIREHSSSEQIGPELLEIKHYPHMRDADNRMRVVVLIAYSDNPVHWPDAHGDNRLSIWQEVLAFEVWIPFPRITATTTTTTTITTTIPTCATTAITTTSTTTTATSSPPDEPTLYNVTGIGRSEIIVCNTAHDVGLRGRTSKLYTLQDPASNNESIDCVALFGMQHNGRSRAVVIKKALFLKDGDDRFARSDATIGKKVSCLALFPDGSGYERLLIVLNRHGRGMIWDWINEREVAELRLPEDAVDNETDPSAGNEDAKELYFWGIEVNWAVEQPDVVMPKEQRRAFRIVSMADGSALEWAVCWWHVDSEMLGTMDVDLRLPYAGGDGDGDTVKEDDVEPVALTHDSPPSTLTRPVWYAIRKRVEEMSFGINTDSVLQEELMHFSAFVTWNQYAIVLTARHGVLVLKMEESQGPVGAIDRQWVSYLEKDSENPLVDLATVHGTLVMTRQFGHVLWGILSN
ncbi:hypothetical protein BGZ94_002862, partial [Podila epigama]